MGSSSSKKDKTKQKEEEENAQENKPVRRFQEQSHHKIQLEKKENENNNNIIKPEAELKLEEEKKEDEEKIKREQEEKMKREQEEKMKREQEEKNRIEEENKREELKQSILRKIMEEENIIKLKFTIEEFINYIIKFFDDFIQIFYSIPKKSLYISLIFEFNKIYIYSFNTKEYPDIPQRPLFFEVLKYTSIVVVCLVFMSKDLELYKKFSSKIKEPIEKFIFSMINIIGKNILKSKTVAGYIKNFKKAKKEPILCINDIIKILFVNGKNAPLYKNLKNALSQILANIMTEPIETLITRINESILFFYNADSYLVIKHNLVQSTEVSTTKSIKSKTTNNTNNINRSKSKNKKKEIKKDENQKDKDKEKEKISLLITDPFISEPMTKDFCLVLDIDETISHTMRLSFGNYFLLRPGVIHLIKKLYKFYEIDIFTAAIKRYADNIINKLDPNDNYIRYRFYREHCIYEGTKTVKKLVRIGRDLNKIIFVDNIKYNAKYNMDNLYHVSSWKDDVYDTEMVKLQGLLVDIIVNGKFKDDIRKGIAGKDDQVVPAV